MKQGGLSILPTANTSFHLNNVPIAPEIMRILLSVCQFTRENHFSFEFDALHALHDLTATWPDLAYTIQQVCLFMHNPQEPHLAFIKRILR
jgi:hypothetical protein